MRHVWYMDWKALMLKLSSVKRTYSAALVSSCPNTCFSSIVTVPYHGDLELLTVLTAMRAGLAWLLTTPNRGGNALVTVLGATAERISVGDVLAELGDSVGGLAEDLIDPFRGNAS